MSICGYDLGTCAIGLFITVYDLGTCAKSKFILLLNQFIHVICTLETKIILECENVRMITETTNIVSIYVHSDSGANMIQLGSICLHLICSSVFTKCRNSSYILNINSMV